METRLKLKRGSGNVLIRNWSATLKYQSSLLSALTELAGGRKRTETSQIPVGLHQSQGESGICAFRSQRIRGGGDSQLVRHSLFLPAWPELLE